MGLWNSLTGTVCIEIISASPADMLTAVNNAGITLLNIAYISDLCVKGTIYRYDYQKLCKLAERRTEKIKVLNQKGLYFTIRNLKKRPVLLAGMALLMILMLYLPTRVLFVSVEGNETIPQQLVIEKAEQCGIVFGASRREVRSERMKNALLCAIPQLQWAGVNTYGCVAVISVRERSVSDTAEHSTSFGSIVATRDGVISELTVLKGNPLCKVGQAVKKGQVLVSGYTDCGLYIQTTQAEAEVKAQTIRNLEVITPLNYASRGEKSGEEVRYSLRIGKNIINFCKDSGISDTTCVKMYKESNLMLPGGFQLPVALIEESLVYYDHTQVFESDNADYSWMEKQAEMYLKTQMLAGDILLSNVSLGIQDKVCLQSGEYFCVEMIGQIRSEEIVKDNGKRD